MNIIEILTHPIETIQSIYGFFNSLVDLYIEFCKILPTPFNIITGILIPVMITIILVKGFGWLK